MKEEKEHWHQRNTKAYKKILWTIICQQTGQPGWNGWTRRNIQLSKTNERIWIESFHLVEVEAVKTTTTTKITSQQTKALDWVASQVEFYQTFRELTPLCKLVHTIQAEGRLPTHFMRTALS